MRTPIQAALLREPGTPLSLETVLLDDPRPDEVVVRTTRVGLCHSDLHYVRGSLRMETPAVLGHEVAGVVERVGAAVTRIAVGDQVVATVTPSCGQCPACLRGRPTQCLRVDQFRTRSEPKVIDDRGHQIHTLGNVGAFASKVLVHEASLAVVAPDLPAQVACLLGCCVTTGVGAVIHGAAITPDDTVVVIGCGGVGIAAIQGARLAGARQVVAVDRVTDKLEHARRLGATATVLSAPDPRITLDLVRALRPQGFSHAIEAVGRPETAELAFASLAPTGLATILGLMPAGERISLSADDLVYGDRRIQGAYMGANRFLSDVELFTDHYRAGRLDLDAMVTRTLAFEDIDKGLDAMADPDTIRVVLEFD